MGNRNFRSLIENQWSHGNFVCVGLDVVYERIPAVITHRLPCGPYPILEQIIRFNQAIVESTKDLVCAYKLNAAFYEAHQFQGLHALYCTINTIQRITPTVPVILDAKRGDIGHTNEGYVTAVFESIKADAITVHPYLGAESLKPFLDQKDKGIFILCRTSNPGAGEFQDLSVDGKPLYQHVARHVAKTWNTHENCGLVVGATYPDELREVRELVGDMPILIPGIGAQGGDVEKAVSAGKDSRGYGMIINSSRKILYASDGSDFADAARRETEKLRTLINRYQQAPNEP